MQNPATDFGQILDEAALARTRTIITLQRTKLDEQALALMAEEVLVRLSESFEKTLRGPAIPNRAEIDAFCDLLIGEDEDAAHEMIVSIREDGASLDTVYLGYFSQAARRLGELWETDKVAFTDVTIASGRMYAIMRAMRHIIAAPPPSSERHAFFASAPCETHTLGVTIAADLLRQRGWEIDLETDRSHDELVAAVRRTDHNIIGLSASHSDSLVALSRLVVAMRIVKPHAFIMISGSITEAVPDISQLIDADCVVSNVPDAVEHMERILAEREASA
ncbi:MAG: cobalamin B12-binding domain-containing protein [Pseudomonadota bacterium]